MDWTQILVALIAAGFLTYVRDIFKWVISRNEKRSPEAREALHVTTADQSLAVVARARDELEADNVRLRSQMAESDARHEAERCRWDAEKGAMRREIDTLERKVRDILEELEQVKLRHH